MKAVVQSFWRRKKMEIDGFSIPQHIFEQIVWRRTEVISVSPSCWDTGTCRVCGCEILGKTMEDRACSASEIGEPTCYPAMMGADVWESYKKDNHIKLFN